MTQGFWLADQIESDFTVAGDSAWYWWTALSPVLGCDPKADPKCPTKVNTKGSTTVAVLRPTPRDGRRDKIFTTKRFDVLGQFSKFVRPGAVRHDVTGVPRACTRWRSRARNWTVVTWNEASTRAQYVLQLPTATKVRSGVATNAVVHVGNVVGRRVADPDDVRIVDRGPPRRRDRDLHVLPDAVVRKEPGRQRPRSVGERGFRGLARRTGRSAVSALQPPCRLPSLLLDGVEFLAHLFSSSHQASVGNGSS